MLVKFTDSISLEWGVNDSGQRMGTNDRLAK